MLTSHKQNLFLSINTYWFRSYLLIMKCFQNKTEKISKMGQFCVSSSQQNGFSFLELHFSRVHCWGSIKTKMCFLSFKCKTVNLCLFEKHFKLFSRKKLFKDRCHLLIKESNHGRTWENVFFHKIHFSTVFFLPILIDCILFIKVLTHGNIHFRST